MKVNACDAPSSMDPKVPILRSQSSVALLSHESKHVAVAPGLDNEGLGSHPFPKRCFAVTGRAKCQIANQ
jgi:hypothetical protein